MPDLPLSAGSEYDLGLTLPASVRRGGTFSVDPGSAPLPSGVVLHPSGRLTVAPKGSGTTRGVVFAYDEPSVDSSFHSGG